MAIVCLDTQILIWAIKEEAEPGQTEMISKAKALIERLDKGNKKILLPALVIGEFLIRIPIETHQTIINLLERDFMIAHYDVKAASFYARIWREKQDQGLLEELKRSGKTRQELKTDRMIVATALANDAESIYSHDKGLEAFGKGYIDIRNISDIPVQRTMFKK